MASAVSLGDFVRAHKLQTLALIGADLHGYARGKKVVVDMSSDDALTVRLPSLFTTLDYANDLTAAPAGDDQWWPGWGEGFQDIRVVPDAATTRVVPWLEASGLALCEFEHANGSGALDFMPRALLKRLIKHARGLGFEIHAALEYEFTLFAESLNSAHAKNFCQLKPLWPSPQAYVMTTLGQYSQVIEPLRLQLQRFGLPIEGWNTEAGPGQMEINLGAQSALEAADTAFLFKYAVKELAARYGALASFMAQIESAGFGNGGHLNLSLWRDGENLFYADDGERHASKLMQQFIAGVVTSLPEFTLMYAPTPNSYRRFELHELSGMMVAAAQDNKTVAVRCVSETPELTRLEQRTGGADANPYLVLAAMLAAGLHGIEAQLPPVREFAGDAYVDNNLHTVPLDINAAIERFENGAVVKHYLGQDFVRFYAHTRRQEAALFAASGANEVHQAVSAWERQRYLAYV